MADERRNRIDWLRERTTGRGEPLDPGMMVPGWLRPSSYTPSRATVQALANPQAEARDAQNQVTAAAAANAAAKAAAGDKTTTEYDTEIPADAPEEKIGTGTLVQRKPGREDPSEYKDFSVVRMPDGQMVATEGNLSALMARGGVVDPEGAKANVAEGAYGTIYSSPEKLLIGQGGANLAGVGLPTDEDRSPGWATRKVYNDLYSQGALSMNARDVMDRRRWEEAEEGRESDIELARARRDLAIMQAQIDPYKMAQLEAEGKYAGTALKEEAQNQRIMAAMMYYARLGNQMSELEKQLASVPADSSQAAALQQAIDRLTQERREWANIAMGFQLRDPRMDPFSAMFGAMASGGAAPTGGEQ